MAGCKGTGSERTSRPLPVPHITLSAAQPPVSIIIPAALREALHQAAGSTAGAALVSGSLDATIRVWQRGRGQASGRALLRGHGGEVKCLAQTRGAAPVFPMTPCRRSALSSLV